MKSLTRTLAALGLVAMLAACASGPKYAEVASAIPTLKAGDGRVYFYRSGSAVGAAVQPTITLNGTEVGKSVPGGFFFVDRPAGNYEIVMGTEVERKVTFTLDAGATRYVKTSISFGVLVGRPQAELVDPTEGRKEVAELSYTGAPLK